METLFASTRVDPVVNRPNHHFLEKSMKVSTGNLSTAEESRIILYNRHHRRVINPHCTYVKRWDIIMVFMLVYTAIVSPFETAFLETKLDGLFVINRIVDVLFFKDLVMRFYLVYYCDKTSTWISNHNKIISHYLRGWFVLDLISILPFEVLGVLAESNALTNLKLARVLRLFRLLKLFRIIKGATIFRRWESKMTITYGLLSLLNFFIAVLLMAHWIACVFRMVVDIEGNMAEDGEPYNWMTEVQYRDVPMHKSPIFHQYVVALYFSIMTLTTIGYGDVVPITHTERIVAVICMLTGGGIYAYVVGGVCQVVTSLDASKTQFHQNMDTLNEYMHQNQVPACLQGRLREFFHNSKLVQRERHFKDLLRNMSPGLRGEVSLHNHKWINRIPFFCCGIRAEQADFIIEIALVLKAACFSPNELVIRWGEHNSKMYLVQRGLATQHRKIIPGGCIFGEDIILHRVRRYFTVRSVSYLHVQILHKQDMERLVESGSYPNTRKLIRRYVMKIAFQKKFVKFARLTKMKRQAFQIGKEMRAAQPRIVAERILEDSYRDLTNAEGITKSADVVQAIEKLQNTIVCKLEGIEKRIEHLEGHIRGR